MGTWFVCAECKWEGKIECPRAKEDRTKHPSGDLHLLCGPNLTVDPIIEYLGRIVLIQRANTRDGTPTGLWALPGGYVDYRERLVDAVVREGKEETGLDLLNPRFFWLYDDPERDKDEDRDADREKGRNNVSVVYTSLGCGTLWNILEKEKEARAKEDGKEFEVAAIRCCTREEIERRRFGRVPEILGAPRTLALGSRVTRPECENRAFRLACDHDRILADYFARASVR